MNLLKKMIDTTDGMIGIVEEKCTMTGTGAEIKLEEIGTETGTMTGIVGTGTIGITEITEITGIVIVIVIGTEDTGGLIQDTVALMIEIIVADEMTTKDTGIPVALVLLLLTETIASTIADMIE